MNEKRRRRWPASTLGWGWGAFSLGVTIAGGAFLAYNFMLYSGGCRRPSTGWGSTRTFFCADVLGRFISPALPWLVLGAMSIGILVGLVVGAAVATRANQWMPGVWLASTSLVYAAASAYLALAPNGGDVAPDLAFSVLPLTALISTGFLVVWLGTTGGLWAIVLAVQTRRRERLWRECGVDVAP